MSSTENIMVTGIALWEGTLARMSPMRPSIISTSIWDSMDSYCLKLLRVVDLFIRIDFCKLLIGFDSILKIKNKKR